MQFPFPGVPARTQAEARQVRETISIREQQQALIAQRRREAQEGGGPVESARELTFKPWQQPDQQRKEKSVPRRAQQSRDPAGLLSVNTAHSDKDIVLASRVRDSLLWS